MITYDLDSNSKKTKKVSNTYNRISIHRGTSGEERRQPGTSPDYLPHSRRGITWRKAPLPAPLLSTSTPKLPKTTLTQVRTQEKRWCGGWCVFLFSSPPLVFIGGNHELKLLELT